MTWRAWCSVVLVFVFTVIPHMLVAAVTAPYRLWTGLVEGAKEVVTAQYRQKVVWIRPVSTPLDSSELKN